MSDLVVVEFSSEEKAEGVRELLLAMQPEYLIEPPDAVVAVRDAAGRVKLSQLFRPLPHGTAAGAFWRPLIGLLSLLPPAMAETAGAGSGRTRLGALGIDGDFVRRASRTLASGNAALFLLVRQATTDKVVAALRGAGGPVLRRSLSEAGEEALRSLANHQTASRR